MDRWISLNVNRHTTKTNGRHWVWLITSPLCGVSIFLLQLLVYCFLLQFLVYRFFAAVSSLSFSAKVFCLSFHATASFLLFSVAIYCLSFSAELLGFVALWRRFGVIGNMPLKQILVGIRSYVIKHMRHSHLHLISYGRHPRIVIACKHLFTSYEIQITKFWWEDCKAIALNVKLP